ncbi:GNAT family N-acetyltransferase [Agromyces archimandritae]|uniref:N-acetyltransferase n=1 Tax=Agromyces archimandritae TaxID=2781962 RepID=A0A975FM94_9MICO|nr:GNAT family N-acetyltransferase [Agromyces archimandritae]QTX03586.1 N-acetyltransferase [Agromyces archimandritae]
MTSDDRIEVTRDDAASRYELRVNGTPEGFAAYTAEPGRITFTHTEVFPGHEGEGLGSALAKAALDDAVARGEQIVPVCPFIAAYVKRHREYDDAVRPAD